MMLWSESTKLHVIAAIQQSLRTGPMRAIKSCCKHLQDHELINDLYIALAKSGKVSHWIFQAADQDRNFEKLKKIVHHACRFELLKLVRQEKRHHHKYLNCEPQDKMEAADESEGIQISRYLPCLPDRLQRVLKLYLFGLSNEEIAKDLAVSTRTIRRYLEQIVKLLRLKIL